MKEVLEVHEIKYKFDFSEQPSMSGLQPSTGRSKHYKIESIDGGCVCREIKDLDKFVLVHSWVYGIDEKYVKECGIRDMHDGRGMQGFISFKPEFNMLFDEVAELCVIVARC